MIQQLRYLFAAYMRDIPHPDDLYDPHGAEIAFGENGMPAWNPDDVLRLDGNSALLTVTRRFLVTDEDRDRTVEWVRGFAKFAGVSYEDLAVSTVRDKGADFDIEVKAHLSLRRAERGGESGKPVRPARPADAPGDAAMMRAAMHAVLENISGRRKRMEWYKSDDEIEAIVKAALAAPVRACDNQGCNTPTEKPMTLDEAIAHAEDVGRADRTQCAREHMQLTEWLKELRELKRAKADAKPRRNCDVGTASEQKKRFDAFCNTHVCCTCRLSSSECRFQWGQMPYDGERE